MSVVVVQVDFGFYQGRLPQPVSSLTQQFRPMAAVQVCASDMTDAMTVTREKAGLMECLSALGLREGTIVTSDREDRWHEDGKTIHLVPAYKWLTEPQA